MLGYFANIDLVKFEFAQLLWWVCLFRLSPRCLATHRKWAFPAGFCQKCEPEACKGTSNDKGEQCQASIMDDPWLHASG
jgi:hypothetical protein